MNYLSGFGNHHLSEAVAGAVPHGQNSPQKHELGLYPEQLSGSSFVAPRHENARSWLYRIQPSVVHGPFEKATGLGIGRLWNTDEVQPHPEQLRWNAIEVPQTPTTFLQGVQTVCANGSPHSGMGLGVHLYAFNQSMEHQYFYDADAELLWVPQRGKVEIKTEFGILHVEPLEIAVIPRGVRFQVAPLDGTARGYLAENFGAPLRLPSLGPIGSNGLAAARDFLVPTAAYEEGKKEEGKKNVQLIAKYAGQFWKSDMDHSPLNVVGWHGNYYPYKYDLKLFNTIGTVSFDHPDPSIFTVLTSPSDTPGTSNLDFVIFPPRWMVAEHTFRPPYYHRNIMSEYMGLIDGAYDAKGGAQAGKGGGFIPGGGSLHNRMSAHGPDAEAYGKATGAELSPVYLAKTMAFMFESRYPFHISPTALQPPFLQTDYLDCWKSLKAQFKI